MLNKKQLWANLKAYHFGHLVPTHLWDHVKETFGGVDASTKAFASKIAKKLDWKTDFTLKAIEEYKKFVYLGIAGDFSVTPSKIIDQIWHEHLLFTKGYRDFCDEVILHQFDHNPELVPVAQQTGVFNAQYLATLDLYKKEFNVDPPIEIWGKPKFDESQVLDGYEPKKKREGSDDFTPIYSDDTPLWLHYDSVIDGGHHSTMPEFGGFNGGDFGGAGAGGSCENSPNSEVGSHSVDSADNDAGADDAGSGDAGGGDSGGSGCSSGCGGSCGS